MKQDATVDEVLALRTEVGRLRALIAICPICNDAAARQRKPPTMQEISDEIEASEREFRPRRALENKP